MWIRKLAAIACLACAALSASAQQGAAPAQTAAAEPDYAARLRAFITLLAAACTPELVEEARKGSRACALIWYGLDANQSQTRLPNALAKTGYRPVVAFTPSPDGNLFKSTIKILRVQDELVYERPVTELASGMTIDYIEPGKGMRHFRYTVIGVVFPALCKTYPDKCGMKSYKSRIFDLREYKEDTFNEIAPRAVGDGIYSLPDNRANTGTLPDPIRN